MDSRLTAFLFAICALTSISARASSVEAQESDVASDVVEATDTEATDTEATDDANARTLFEAGLIAYEAARFRVALQNFQSAYDLSPRPQLLFNVGLAYERLGDDTAALESFELYLELATTGADRQEVERRVATLQTRRDSRASSDESPTSNTAAWVLLGSGVAVVAVGAATLGIGLSKRASVTGSDNGELEWPEAESRFDRGTTLTVVGAVGLGVGAALSAVSFVLFRGGGETTVSTNGTMLFVSGRL